MTIALWSPHMRFWHFQAYLLAYYMVWFQVDSSVMINILLHLYIWQAVFIGQHVGHLWPLNILRNSSICSSSQLFFPWHQFIPLLTCDCMLFCVSLSLSTLLTNSNSFEKLAIYKSWYKPVMLTLQIFLNFPKWKLKLCLVTVLCVTIWGTECRIFWLNTGKDKYVFRKYGVIHKSLWDFRPLRYNSRDGHAKGEDVNRGKGTPSFCPTLQVLNMSTLGDAEDVNPVISLLPHTLQHLAVDSSDCLHNPSSQLW
jgi:hypothetical protein